MSITQSRVEQREARRQISQSGALRWDEVPHRVPTERKHKHQWMYTWLDADSLRSVTLHPSPRKLWSREKRRRAQKPSGENFKHRHEEKTSQIRQCHHKDLISPEKWHYLLYHALEYNWSKKYIKRFNLKRNDSLFLVVIVLMLFWIWVYIYIKKLKDIECKYSRTKENILNRWIYVIFLIMTLTQI